MNLHRLDLVSLALLNTVVRAGSLSKGAEMAHLSLAATSKRISDLEAAVGAELFERHSRGVTLTHAGQALHRHAQKILADVDALASELSDHAQGVVGVIRLWANTSAVTQFLPRDLASFSQAHPGIRFALHEGNGDDIVRAVLDGRGDLGIFAENTPALGLQTRSYREDRLLLVVPSGHALADRESVAFAELTAHDVVSLHADTSLAEKLAHEARVLGQSLRVRVHVRSFDAMGQMVAAGLGIAVMPDVASAPLATSLGLVRVPLTDDWVVRRLQLGARDFAALDPSARGLVEHLVGRATGAPAPA